MILQQLSLFQLLFVSVSILLIVRSFLLFIRGKKTLREFTLAFFFWCFIALIWVSPILLDKLANLLGITLGVNFVLIVSVVILAVISLKQVLYNEKLENSITRLVRENALTLINESKNDYDIQPESRKKRN